MLIRRLLPRPGPAAPAQALAAVDLAEAVSVAAALAEEAAERFRCGRQWQLSANEADWTPSGSVDFLAATSNRRVGG